MPDVDLLTDEMKTASIRDLGMAKEFLGTEYIEGVAWHTEQAFEKLVMYAYAKYKIVVLGQDAQSIAQKLKETWHPVKHHLTINLLHEMFSTFGGRLNRASSNPASVVADPSLQPSVQKFAQRIKDLEYVRQILERLESIEAEIDQRTKNSKGFRELVSISTEGNARVLLANKPDIASALEFARQNLRKLSPGAPVSALIDPAIDKLGDLFRDLYTFPYVALNIAPLILPHSLTSRYPIMETDFENLMVYRENRKSLGGFFTVMMGGIEELTESVEAHVEALRDVNSIMGV